MIYFLAGTGESQFPLSSSCSAKAVESSFYVSPYELNANSISDIKTFIFRGHPMLKIYTLRKRIKMAGRDHPSFVPPCGTAGDR